MTPHDNMPYLRGLCLHPQSVHNKELHLGTSATPYFIVLGLQLWRVVCAENRVNPSLISRPIGFLDMMHGLWPYRPFRVGAFFFSYSIQAVVGDSCIIDLART